MVVRLGNLQWCFIWGTAPRLRLHAESLWDGRLAGSLWCRAVYTGTYALAAGVAPRSPLCLATPTALSLINCHCHCHRSIHSVRLNTLMHISVDAGRAAEREKDVQDKDILAPLFLDSIR